MLCEPIKTLTKWFLATIIFSYIIRVYTRCWQNDLLANMIFDIVLTQIESVFNLKVTNVLDVRKRFSVHFFNGKSCVKQEAQFFSSDVYPLLEVSFSWVASSSFDLSWRGSLKGTKRNLFVILHVLRASIYMSKRPKDEGASQASHVHIKRLANIVFKSRTRRLFNSFVA